MADPDKKQRKPGPPNHEVITKADRRFAKADKQRAGIEADPKGEVIREQERVRHSKKKKPDT